MGSNGNKHIGDNVPLIVFLWCLAILAGILTTLLVTNNLKF